MKSKRLPLLISPVLVALFFAAALVDWLLASESTATMAASDLVVVADTTATMQPELAALSNAWPGTVISADSQDRLFHLLQYKDSIRYEGQTKDVQQFGAWLSELKAAGGGDCEDAMFQALAAAARGAPDSRALLLSDSAPQGDRSKFAFIMNKLIERGVLVYPVISGWCDGAELSQTAMFSLARMTGGIAHIHGADETETAARSTLDLMPLEDTILVANTSVDGVQVYPLVVDSTATTLGVDDQVCSPTWCLTCTLAVQGATSVVETTSAIKLMVKDPDGNLLKAGDPGVEVLETSSGTSFIIDVDEVYTPTSAEMSATWEVIVQGSGDHVLNAVADSAVHLDYLGKHVLPANKERLIRAALSTGSGAPSVEPSTVQFAVKHAMNGKVMPIDLFDDGQHGDGQAGDGIYGGPVTVKRGLWYLAAKGELSDGGAFERMVEVPIRVKGFSASQPKDQQQVAGNSSTVQFQVTNDEVNALAQVSSKVYEVSVDSLLGWSTADGVPESIVLAPGETETINVLVEVPEGADLGDVEETFLTVVESNDIGSSDTVTVKTTVVDKMAVYLPATIGD